MSNPFLTSAPMPSEVARVALAFDHAKVVIALGGGYVPATVAALQVLWAHRQFTPETLRRAVRDYAVDADRHEVEAIARLWEERVGVVMLKGRSL